MRKKRRLWRRLRPATWLLLICCSLSFWIWTSCKPEIQQVPVAIGDAKIVGRWTAGAAKFEPGEDPAGEYLIVTRSLWLTTYRLAWKVRMLELRIKELKAEGKK